MAQKSQKKSKEIPKKRRQGKKRMAQVLSGLSVRDQIQNRLKKVIETRLSQGLLTPCLAILQVGDVQESSAYIRQKKIFGEKIGAKVQHLQFETSVSEKELIREIRLLNDDPTIQGIIVQLPLPAHISVQNVIEAIIPYKDVDGLTAINAKRLAGNLPGARIPATARGVMNLCLAYDIDPKGKDVVVVGRSALVGRPTAQLFLNAGSTVTICHRGTRHLSEHTNRADILIVAAGVPVLIGAKHVRKGQIVIDVGITVITKEDKKNKGIMRRVLKGDVNEEQVAPVVKALSPVPGGIGPLTVASLFENLLEVIE